MAINYELLNKGGISLGTNFELLSEKPLDSRLVVPSLDGLQNYIDNAAAYSLKFLSDEEFFSTKEDFFYITENILNNLKGKYDIEFYSLNLYKTESDRKGK